MVEENKDLLNKMFAGKVVTPNKPGDSGPVSGKDEIVCIIDRSGSMFSIALDAQGGLNSFIEEQKKVENGANLTIVEFDDTVDIVCDRIDINEATPYQLHPRNSTALLDAIGSVIGNQLKYKAEGTTIVVVVTDGGENSSKEWTRDQIFKLMEERKAEGWEFMFLAANQDAIQTAQQYGFDPDSAASFAASGKGVQDVYSMSTGYTTNLRSVGKAHAMKGKADFIQANLDTLSDIGEVGDIANDILEQQIEDENSIK